MKGFWLYLITILESNKLPETKLQKAFGAVDE